ncbi:hypothetical protein IFU40_05600 [Microbacterium sp. CFBP 13617]|uniref:hypothetical protein n=1 Tax=Microbacterium sp. CFBP 13617 TaxID=2774035 RepID=UPI00178040A4|nr:hypothetical protein [Microbacterium sp. CFBP 13617]MBD8218111.1 hypothetical protein [Microbacterium sp. CFBP 13617]
MTMPTREQMFEAIEPQDAADHARMDRERDDIERQARLGLTLQQIVQLGGLDRIAAMLSAPALDHLDAIDPAAAEHVRSVCHQRLIALSSSD